MTPIEIVASPAETGAETASEAGPDARDEATMTRIDPGPSPATMTRIDPAPSSATMTRIHPAQQPAAPPRVGTSAAYTPTTPVAATPATLDIDPTVWVVEPGDSLWSIAEDVTSSATGPPPSERDVSHYWQRLVRANRANLVDPDNPDLLLPGQQVVVPPTDG